LSLVVFVQTLLGTGLSIQCFEDNMLPYLLSLLIFFATTIICPPSPCSPLGKNFFCPFHLPLSVVVPLFPGAPPPPLRRYRVGTYVHRVWGSVEVRYPYLGYRPYLTSQALCFQAVSHPEIINLIVNCYYYRSLVILLLCTVFFQKSFSVVNLA
jgi:hypothetical protein